MWIKSVAMRWALPVAALLLFLGATRFIATGRTQSSSVEPKQSPATAPIENVKVGVVAGAGVVQPSSELVGIGSPVPGVVKAVAVKVGDEVSAGQILFTIDDREASAEVATRQASFNLAKLNVQTSAIEAQEKAANLALYESIGDKRAMTQDELIRRQFSAQSATTRLEASKAGVAQASAQLEQARTGQSLRVVRSPFDATVLQLKVRVGEFAPAMQLSEPLLTIGATRPMHVKIDIDEADISRADLKSPATVSPRGAASNQVKAQFVRVEPLVVPKKSLTNSASERVDTRVLQVVYALPPAVVGFYLGQQVDAFLAAIPANMPPPVRGDTGAQTPAKNASGIQKLSSQRSNQSVAAASKS